MALGDTKLVFLSAVSKQPKYPIWESASSNSPQGNAQFMGKSLGSSRAFSDTAVLLWPQRMYVEPVLGGGPASLSISQDRRGHHLHWNFYIWGERLFWTKKTGHNLLLEQPMVWGSFVHGILQAKILAWVAIPFSRASSQPRDWTQVSHIACRFFTIWATILSEFRWPLKMYLAQIPIVTFPSSCFRIVLKDHCPLVA